MTNVQWKILKRNRRPDGTWKVYILLSHNGERKYIPTSIYVTERDLTPSFKIRNGEVMEKIERTVAEYRSRLNSVDLEFSTPTIATVEKSIRWKKGAAVNITKYYEEVWLVENRAKKGLRNYKTAWAAYQRFLGSMMVMSDCITSRMMRLFVDSLSDRPRAASLYANAVAKIFGDARKFFNDEDNGMIVIRHSLASFHAPRQNVAKKRALSVDAIRRIFALPYKEGDERRNRALDCFKLSFCLMGMNSADMFSATDYEDGCISYCRQKTRGRRQDAALMRTRVPNIIRGVFERHRDSERVFDFYRSFANESNFNKSINQGLKKIGHEIGIEGLQFYAARHSMASIAVNKAGIDRWTVNAMLNHIDPDMRVTELYIEKDFTPLDNANERLMDFVFRDEAQGSRNGALIVEIGRF